ncbi:FtsB family cell division protein [Pseudoflavonifractor phocaeensis]|uniref:FtsB family cell division protein n=1 Tax=Pseudoflavonifractor phocaeensis TaxID=1870988 RepID=UPI001FAE913A|nr:septum formation initiator family protein [Pseudoflavonifractor phocaeensis]
MLTKIVVLALLVAAVTAVLDLQGQIAAAEAQKAELEAQVAAQEQTNADLQDAVDHSDDPERKEDLARSKLGLAAPDEQIIIFTD